MKSPAKACQPVIEGGRIRRFFAERAYFLVFLSLIAVPAVNLLPFAMDSDIKSQCLYFIDIAFGINLFITYRKSIPQWMVGLGIVSGILGSIISAINLSSIPIIIHHVAGISFFCFFSIICYIVFRRVVTYTVSNRETVYAAVSGYLLIGFIAFFLFSELEQIMPGSFVMASDNKPAGPTELFYFAYVTILTIGYGDIAPVTLPARNATILMAVLGYTYSLVFIARIVSDLRRNTKKSEAEDNIVDNVDKPSGK